MLKPNLLKCFTTTLMHRLSQFSASQDSMPNMQTHEVHSEVKLVCLLSEQSSSMCILRLKFAGSQVPTQAALSVCLEIPLLRVPVWLKQVGITYKIKVSLAQKLPSRKACFACFGYFVAFSVGYPAIYICRLSCMGQNKSNCLD